MFKISTAIANKYRERTPQQEEAEDKFQAAYRKYIAGFLAMNPKGKYYPDANSTLRLTYGTVRALPKDKRNDAKVNYYTTLDGTIAKYKPNDEEFDLPAKLLEITQKQRLTWPLCRQKRLYACQLLNRPRHHRRQLWFTGVER
ncbi:S46 family peptidase [Sphingobacterium sp. T2]|uniref:S46 family peptidase n=1 Tax=Sphingobacterium sp. T2 TaxID=1590596 RepID=UPI000AFCF5A7|nr:S46 family peptidase [Sphingobacterium sp. T2]